MKKVVAAFLVVGAFSQAAQAKTLEDVLREKGVITEEDYKEITKSAPFRYKLGDGFTFTAPDQKFQLSIGGRLQTRFTYNDLDSRTGADTDNFRVRRMKVWMKGYAYTKDLSYLLQLDFAPSAVNIFEHGYLDYKFTDELQLLAGQTKVPFGRQWLNSSGAQEFVDRSFASDFFRPGYDTGVKLHGDLLQGITSYDLGIYGGAGQSAFRSDTTGSTNYAYAGRVTVNPFGKMSYSEADLDFSAKPLLSIGVDYYANGLKATRTAATGTVAASTAFEPNNVTLAGSNGWLGRSATRKFTATQNVDFDTYGFDAAFKWMGLYLEGEYLAGNAKARTTAATLHADGFFAQAGYCIIPKTFEAAIRYSYVDPARDVRHDHQTDVQGALSWYFNKHNLKLQGDVSGIHKQVPGGVVTTDDMVYRVQAQLIF